MNKWVILSDGWVLRPNQDGLEIVGPEQNISLELPASKEERIKIANILLGEREVPEVNSSTDLRDVLANFENQGILRFSEYKPHKREKSTPIQQKLWRLREGLVGSRGPVSCVYRLDPMSSRFSPAHSYIFSARYDVRSEQNDILSEFAYGVDENQNLAELKAIMEAIERHASGVIPSEELIKTSARKLGKTAIDPRQVVTYSKAQYKNSLPLVPFSTSREYYWKEVFTYPERSMRYLPVECLY